MGTRLVLVRASTGQPHLEHRSQLVQHCVQDAALAFCEDHALDTGIAGPLARHIQGNLERANQDALAQVISSCILPQSALSVSAALPACQQHMLKDRTPT